jgi:hypothetical protein
VLNRLSSVFKRIIDCRYHFFRKMNVNTGREHYFRVLPEPYLEQLCPVPIIAPHGNLRDFPAELVVSEL